MSNTVPAVGGSRGYRYTARSWITAPPAPARAGGLLPAPKLKAQPEHAILAFTDGDVRQTQQWCSDRFQHGNFRKALNGIEARIKAGPPKSADGSGVMGAVFTVAVSNKSKYSYAPQGHIPHLDLTIYSRLYTPDQPNAIGTFSDVFIMEVETYTNITIAVMNADPQKMSFRVVDDY